MPRATHTEPTHFLNVDLDVYSRVPLDPLIAALGKRVVVLFVGREGRRYSAHLCLPSYGQSADLLTRRLARLIERLPRPARKLWDGATSRVLNIGIQAGLKPGRHELGIGAETVAQIARLNGRILVTTYALGVSTG